MYDYMIYGYMLEDHTKPIEITIYTNLSESILNEQCLLFENGGSINLDLYSNNLKRAVVVHIRSKDCAGFSDNSSKHSASIKLKKEQSTLGGDGKGIPIIVPKSKDETAYFDPKAIRDPNKLILANKTYKDVLEFVNKNAKILYDIWWCTTPDSFNNLINILIKNNSNLH